MTGTSREHVRISRRMSLVLRHRPEVAGLTLDPHGWVPVDDLLAALGVDRATLDAVVADDKERFAVETGSDGVDRIRASQGHSPP
jgi:putative RNA 2'-phosphotransferase